MDLALGAHLDIGWLWMQRFRALDGLGIFIRPMYRGDIDFALGGGKPSNRNMKDAKKADAGVAISLASLRRGPWLDVGLVW